MRQFYPFLVQKVSGTCWHPFDLASAQYRSAFVDDWQMYRVPRSLDEIEVSNLIHKTVLRVLTTERSVRDN